MQQRPDTYVRFYFDLGVSWLIPTTPQNEGAGAVDAEWERSCLRDLEEQITAKLAPTGFQCTLRQHHPIDLTLRVFMVEFVVSILHPFPAITIVRSRSGAPGFRVKKKFFEATTDHLSSMIASALRTDFVINNICLSYAASRYFVFEVFLEGYLSIQNTISEQNIRDAGGSVRSAINAFNEEVSSLLENLNWTSEPQTTGKRPRDGIYKFGILATRYMSFAEDEVDGDFSTISQDTNSFEIDCLECKYDSIPDRVLDEQNLINNELSHLNVIELICFYVDNNQDVFDYGNELCQYS